MNMVITILCVSFILNVAISNDLTLFSFYIPASKLGSQRIFNLQFASYLDQNENPILNYTNNTFLAHKEVIRRTEKVFFDITRNEACFDSQIVKLSDYDFTILYVQLIFYLLLLMVCVLFRNSQPLSSR
jgi:hypothetical protein